MSIIHEALKKIDPSQPADPQGSDKQPMRPEAPFRRRASSGNWGPLFVIMVCFLIAGPFLFPLLVKAPGSSSPEEASTARGQFAIEEAPRPVASVQSPWHGFTRPAAFVLSGVVYSGEDSYCLINGLVLRQGERVGNATIDSITPDRVTLDRGGEKIVLPVTVS